MFWHGRPFLRILLFFVAGILIARQINTDIPFSIIELILILCFLIGGIVVLANRIKSFKYRWITGIIIDITLLFAGLTLTLQQISQSNMKLDKNPDAIWDGRILSEPVQRAKTVKFVLKILKRADHDSVLPRSIKILAYLKTDTLPARIHMGSVILFTGKMNAVETPKNPGEFDYHSFLLDRGIRYSIFIDNKRWTLLPVQSRFLLTVVFSHWRNKLLQSLRSQGLSQNEYAVAAAILLGYDQLITPDLHQDFTAAGAVHILCVSGMHVGIVFLIFNFLFSFIVRFKNGQTLRNILLMLVIWTYALLTGLSPSVLRASTMISLFILAGIFQRDYDNFNILAASAFLLLLLNPLLIFDVGFQLSYAAVGGILMFYFPLYRSVYFGNKILQTIWAALIVSVSAELGAFAIAAHYFHQFPIYFLLTNLAVFVLSYLIIFSGLAFLAFSWIPFINHLLAVILGKMVSTLITIVQFVASIPFSTVNNLYFPWYKVALIFALLIWSYYFFIHKKIHMTIPILVTIAILMMIHTFRQEKLLSQEEFIIYSLPHHTAIDLISGKKHLLLADSMALVKPSALEYSLKNNRIAMGLSENIQSLSQSFHTPFFYYRSGFGQIGAMRFYITPSRQEYFPKIRKKIQVDYLILRAPGKIKLEEIAKSIYFRQVILETSLPYWAVKSLKIQAKKLNVNYLYLKSTGAFILDLQKK